MKSQKTREKKEIITFGARDKLTKWKKFCWIIFYDYGCLDEGVEMCVTKSVINSIQRMR